MTHSPTTGGTTGTDLYFTLSHLESDRGRTGTCTGPEGGGIILRGRSSTESLRDGGTTVRGSTPTVSGDRSVMDVRFRRDPLPIARQKTSLSLIPFTFHSVPHSFTSPLPLPRTPPCLPLVIPPFTKGRERKNWKSWNDDLPRHWTFVYLITPIVCAFGPERQSRGKTRPTHTHSYTHTHTFFEPSFFFFPFTT